MSARTSLIMFKVSYNNLETFSEENLGIFPRPGVDSGTSTYKPYVEGNPLRCDCRLFWLQKLTQASMKCGTGSTHHKMPCNTAYRHHPLYMSLAQGPSGFTCHYPENVRGKPLFKVDLSACDVPHSVTSAKKLPKSVFAAAPPTTPPTQCRSALEENPYPRTCLRPRY
ncbi:hypothetical protein Bbelb_069680 [Branchiostoma belcheri]|nr:hypothetical protein Bbelb_069680 [Branchiostoma belcheri]